jgi:hypothetical protein
MRATNIPRLFVFANLAHVIINDVADLIKNGDRIVPYQEYYDKIFKKAVHFYL